jgi:hypothetical protein
MKVVRSGVRPWVQAVEPVLGRQPQKTTAVLAYMLDEKRDAVRSKTADGMVCKSFSHGIEAVQGLIGANPERTRPILEQGIDINATQTLFVSRFMLEHFEFVAIVAVQAVLGREPQKPLIVLHYLGNACLRKSRRRGNSTEPEIIPVDHRQPDGSRSLVPWLLRSHNR